MLTFLNAKRVERGRLISLLFTLREKGEVPVLLLVDDDDLVRAATATALTEKGFAILSAGNGHEALDVLHRAARIDAVILDILMPGMDGIETLREIRKQWPAIPVIAISGGFRSGWADALSMAAKLGATRTLSKPFIPRDLIEIVDAAITEARHG
jgi:CheY-like chemotaxis protein